MARPHTWVIDLSHYIDDETDDWVEELPGPALNLAIAMGSIVAWVTDHLPAGDPHTNVACWRSPGRRRCRGDIMAELGPDSEIVWQCPVCRANGLIHGWKGTLWDRGPGVNDVPMPRYTEGGHPPVAALFTHHHGRSGRISVIRRSEELSL